MTHEERQSSESHTWSDGAWRLVVVTSRRSIAVEVDQVESRVEAELILRVEDPRGG
jgi:hypothetical protein